MSIQLRIVVDREECFSFGICVETLPEIFVLDEEGKSVAREIAGDTVRLDLLKEAVDGCPRAAITVVDGEGRVT